MSSGRRRITVRSHIRNGRRVRSYTQVRQVGRAPNVANFRQYEAEHQHKHYHQQKDEEAKARRRVRQEEDIRLAADFCIAAFEEGGISTAADRVAGHVSDKTFNTLYRKWKPVRCKWLAQLAQEILDTNAMFHSTFADVATTLSSRTFRHEPERIFAHELYKNVPLPGDEQFIATAHGVRMIGVYLCAMKGFDLTSCACFRPLAIEHTKEHVKEYLVVTGTSWIQRPA